MCSTVGENEGLGSDKSFCNGNEAGFEVATSIEDLARKIAVGNEDYEPEG